MLAAGGTRLARQHVGDGLLEGRGHVRDGDRLAVVPAGLDPARDRRLEASEGEVERAIMQLGAREPDRVWRPFPGRLVNGRAAGERHAKHAGHLVVSFAGRVVDRRAERVHVACHVRHEQQGRMAARDKQRHARGGQWAVLKLVNGDVGSEVVHTVERLAERVGVGLRRRDAHHQRASQSGTGGDRYGVDAGRLDACLGERALEHGDHRLQVRPACHFWHHAAEPGVLIHRRRYLVGKQFPASDNADARLIARRLDAEH